MRISLISPSIKSSTILPGSRKIKIAVGTSLLAKWNMNVNTRHYLLSTILKVVPLSISEPFHKNFAPMIIFNDAFSKR
jgi:hypothetical protein